jgi:hypothetical protein
MFAIGEDILVPVGGGVPQSDPVMFLIFWPNIGVSSFAALRSVLRRIHRNDQMRHSNGSIRAGCKSSLIEAGAGVAMGKAPWVFGGA